MKALLARASVAAALALCVPALAYGEGGVEVGTLSCHQASGWGYILGSSRPVSCIYSGSWGQSRYVGRMTEAGVDVGYHGDSQMVWAVFAPTNEIGPGALAGHYGGATAGGAVGVGVAASGLLGGSDRTIHLQPFSITGKTGLHATAGIQGMTLVYEPPPPRTAWAYAPPHHQAHARAQAYAGAHAYERRHAYARPPTPRG
jgi:hypothetical protein